MNLTQYVDDLQRRLATAAEMGGTEAKELAQRLAQPLDAAVRLVLLEALSAAAGEISAELAPGSVDVRLRGREPEFFVSGVAREGSAPAPASPAAGPAPVTPTAPGAEEGATTRTTLRLPEHIKAQVETAAALDGVSVNTWLVRAVTAALEQTTGRPAAPATPVTGSGTRFTGWVR